MQTNSRFIFVSHGNGTNGAELCLIETVKALKLQGCDDIYVLLKKGGSYMEELLQESGAKIRYVRKNPRWVDYKLNWRQKLLWVRSTLIIFKEFLKIFGELKPDYVITNTIVCNPASAIAAKIHRCKHVWYIHELGDKDHGYHYYFGKGLTWFIIKMFSDRIIFNSQFTREYFCKKNECPDNKFRVIYYAVPIDRFKKGVVDFDKGTSDKWKAMDTWKILVSGRTVKGKGQEDIINALGIVKNVHGIVDFHLTIVGKVQGEYFEKLLSLIEQHKLASHVSILPFMENPANYYKEAHIGVTTSRNEAFGRITVEYLKSNMIVIGANAGGTNEIIQNNINGYLYELGNIDQFAEMLLRVMSDKNRSREFADSAKQKIEGRFNLTLHGSEIKDFLLSQ